MKHFQISLLVFILCICVFKLNAQSDGGTTSGAAIYCANANSGFVNLDSYTGTITAWLSSIDSGQTWQPTGSCCIDQYSYSALASSTCFCAVVKDGSFPPDTSSFSCIDIYPPSVAGTIIGGKVSCILPGTGSGVLTLTADTGAVLYWLSSTDSGASWTQITNTTDSLNYTNTTQNTLYKVAVQSGSTCPIDTSDVPASFTFDSLSVAGTISASDTVCPGDSDTLSLAGNVGGILTWLSSTDNSTWLAISNTNALQPYDSLLQTTYYKAVVQNGTCPADTATPVAITIIPNPISAGTDTSIALGQSIVLNGTGNGTALWTPSTELDSANIFQPTATPTSTTMYLLTVTDNNSCISSDSVLITVFVLEFDGVVTNLFTPNGDGINDTWFIKDIDKYPENEVFVYNIYGNLVFTKKGYTNDWQGTYNGAELPDGTYYYVLRFDDNDIVTKGALDILRSR